MEEEIFSLSTINTIKCGAKFEVHHSALTRIAFQDSEVRGEEDNYTICSNSFIFFKNNIYVNVIYISPVLLEKC